MLPLGGPPLGRPPGGDHELAADDPPRRRRLGELVEQPLALLGAQHRSVRVVDLGVVGAVGEGVLGRDLTVAVLALVEQHHVHHRADRQRAVDAVGAVDAAHGQLLEEGGYRAGAHGVLGVAHPVVVVEDRRHRVVGVHGLQGEVGPDVVVATAEVVEGHGLGTGGQVATRDGPVVGPLGVVDVVTQAEHEVEVGLGVEGEVGQVAVGREVAVHVALAREGGEAHPFDLAIGEGLGATDRALMASCGEPVVVGRARLEPVDVEVDGVVPIGGGDGGRPRHHGRRGELGLAGHLDTDGHPVAVVEVGIDPGPEDHPVEGRVAGGDAVGEDEVGDVGVAGGGRAGARGRGDPAPAGGALARLAPHGRERAGQTRAAEGDPRPGAGRHLQESSSIHAPPPVRAPRWSWSAAREGGRPGHR